jgi:hypothetical protein
LRLGQRSGREEDDMADPGTNPGKKVRKNPALSHKKPKKASTKRTQKRESSSE